MRARPRSPAAGFALPEILAALTVFAVGVLGVAAMTLAVSRHAGSAAAETAQVLAARAVADSVRAADEIVPGTGADSALVLGRRWPVSWSVGSVAGGRLHRLRVTVAGRRVGARTFDGRVGRP